MTHQDVLWGIPWILLLLELADNPAKITDKIEQAVEELDDDMINQINKLI